MHPIKTADLDIVYRGPTEDIGDLWCRRKEGAVCSVWRPTDEERALLAAGGAVELAIYTEPIPPVSLVVRPKEDSIAVDYHGFKVPEAA